MCEAKGAECAKTRRKNTFLRIHKRGLGPDMELQGMLGLHCQGTCIGSQGISTVPWGIGADYLLERNFWQLSQRKLEAFGQSRKKQVSKRTDLRAETKIRQEGRM